MRGNLDIRSRRGAAIYRPLTGIGQPSRAGHPMSLRHLRGRSLETSHGLALLGRPHPSLEWSPSGGRWSSMNADGEPRSPIRPDSDWCAPCARGSNPAPACRRSSIASMETLHIVWCPPWRNPGSRRPTQWADRHDPGPSNRGSSTRTQWTSSPKSPSVRCSSNPRPSRGRTCRRSASCRPRRRGASGRDPSRRLAQSPRVGMAGAELPNDTAATTESSVTAPPTWPQEPPTPPIAAAGSPLGLVCIGPRRDDFGSPASPTPVIRWFGGDRRGTRRRPRLQGDEVGRVPVVLDPPRERDARPRVGSCA